MNRFFGILGTCWIIAAAMAHKGAYCSLVEINQENEQLCHTSRISMREHPFQQFLQEFIPQLARKSKDLNKATWILETTSLEDAADLQADLSAEVRFLFNDSSTYEQLVRWENEGTVQDPILKRELNILVRAFKQNQVPKALLEEISKRESALAQTYGTFRAMLDGQPVSENEIRARLRTETNVAERKKAWESSKEIGPILAPQILELVRLRNQAAHALGYSDYFQMQLELQEVDRDWLLKTLEGLGRDSDAAYAQVAAQINESLAERFSVAESELGPWAWSEPFGQEDPLDSKKLDSLVDGVDIPAASASFYARMGIDVNPILKRSDMYERPGKSQHAFCINIDRLQDIRTLNNVRPTIKWLETVLHELGHAIYEMGFDPKLPWLLREPPHMITTEAMALLAGRQAYRYQALKSLIGTSPEKEPILQSVDQSIRRRQLIFSRWVLVMTAFESELYRDPSQDLNRLWWSLVEKHQKIKAPQNREGKMDWACKYHIGLAPVYYFSYLLGEMFASAIQESLLKETHSNSIETPAAGRFLNQKLFYPGNRMPWYELIEFTTGAPLTGEAWLREFAQEGSTPLVIQESVFRRD